MIEERYVSFEVAKMLKEKGFDEPCRSYFIDDTGDYRRCAVEITNKHCSFEQSLRPTLYMTMEWLRKKGIEIETRVDFDCISEPPTYAFVGYSAKIYTIENAINVDEIHIDRHETLEETIETSIMYSLENLI